MLSKHPTVSGAAPLIMGKSENLDNTDVSNLENEEVLCLYFILVLKDLGNRFSPFPLVSNIYTAVTFYKFILC